MKRQKVELNLGVLVESIFVTFSPCGLVVFGICQSCILR